MSNGFNLKKEEIIAALKQLETQGRPPHDVKITELTELNERITTYTLRAFGGLKCIVNATFPLKKDLGAIFQQKEIQKELTRLEKQAGEVDFLTKTIAEAIEKNIAPISVKSYSPKKKQKNSAKVKRTHMVAMLNDLHVGLNVDPKEVNGINEYNFKIAGRRVAFFVDELCHFKLDKRDRVERLHLLLNGDLVGGIIHGLASRDYELLTHQFNGCVHILTHAIARLAENYKNVSVYFSTGNHGDSPHRREGGRVISQIYDSIEGQIFYAVSAAHRKTKNVEFVAGHTLYQDFQLPAGRAAITHGHLMFSKALGNPGTSINNKSLGAAIADFNNSEISRKKPPVKLFLFGHTHVYFSLMTKDGTLVYNAPSLSGVDSYAYSIGINYNNVGQLMFESTDKYIMGDNRLLYVQEADHNPRFDDIIPVYDKDLVFDEK